MRTKTLKSFETREKLCESVMGRYFFGYWHLVSGTNNIYSTSVHIYTRVYIYVCVASCEYETIKDVSGGESLIYLKSSKRRAR